jgi:hypothetical protein
MLAIDMFSENTTLMASASMRHKLAPRLHVLRPGKSPSHFKMGLVVQVPTTFGRPSFVKHTACFPPDPMAYQEYRITESGAFEYKYIMKIIL